MEILTCWISCSIWHLLQLFPFHLVIWSCKLVFSDLFWDIWLFWFYMFWYGLRWVYLSVIHRSNISFESALIVWTSSNFIDQKSSTIPCMTLLIYTPSLLTFCRTHEFFGASFLIFLLVVPSIIWSLTRTISDVQFQL